MQHEHPRLDIPSARPARVLLSGVFGPFGVDDAYGRKENIMELFHNQVTKGQGAASFRFFHRSFGLYFIAANIDAEVTVLDFPSKERFTRELRRGEWDVVGISFIAPNFVKAREMARLVRKHAPGARVVLGGHGAAIEGVETLVDCDHVVKGEGIRWMRCFLGQDPDAPLVHPVLSSAEREQIHGIPVPPPASSLLVPGVGCVNGCKFCATSHFFGRTYTPFLGTGRDIFRLACQISDERGTNGFFVMDENFLKDRGRALELLGEMERHHRFFDFHIFSSAEAITAFGLDNMVRLGVSFVWIGVESSTPRGNYQKNVGIDPRKLVRELRDRGISVLASGILCEEHHTPENIGAEVDFMVGLEADMVQFMLLTPMPVTALYRDLQRRGLLREDLPFEEWHGQKLLSFRHPHFTDAQVQHWIKEAFRREYLVNSSSLYRTAETAYRGFRRLNSLTERDACLQHRWKELRARMRQYGQSLSGLRRLGVNEAERRRAADLQRRIAEISGPPTAAERVQRVAVTALMARWMLRLRLLGDHLQPRTIVTRYPAGEARRGAGVHGLTVGAPSREAKQMSAAARVAVTA